MHHFANEIPRRVLLPTPAAAPVRTIVAEGYSRVISLPSESTRRGLLPTPLISSISQGANNVLQNPPTRSINPSYSSESCQEIPHRSRLTQNRQEERINLLEPLSHTSSRVQQLHTPEILPEGIELIPNRNILFCTICNSTVHPNYAEAHADTIDHKANGRKLIHKINDTDYKCVICGEILGPMQEVRDHLNSQNHRARKSVMRDPELMALKNSYDLPDGIRRTNSDDWFWCTVCEDPLRGNQVTVMNHSLKWAHLQNLEKFRNKENKQSRDKECYSSQNNFSLPRDEKYSFPRGRDSETSRSSPLRDEVYLSSRGQDSEGSRPGPEDYYNSRNNFSSSSLTRDEGYSPSRRRDCETTGSSRSSQNNLPPSTLREREAFLQSAPSTFRGRDYDTIGSFRSTSGSRAEEYAPQKKFSSFMREREDPLISSSGLSTFRGQNYDSRGCPKSSSGTRTDEFSLQKNFSSPFPRGRDYGPMESSTFAPGSRQDEYSVEKNFQSSFPREREAPMLPSSLPLTFRGRDYEMMASSRSISGSGPDRFASQNNFPSSSLRERSNAPMIPGSGARPEEFFSQNNFSLSLSRDRESPMGPFGSSRFTCDWRPEGYGSQNNFSLSSSRDREASMPFGPSRSTHVSRNDGFPPPNDFPFSSRERETSMIPPVSVRPTFRGPDYDTFGPSRSTSSSRPDGYAFQNNISSFSNERDAPVLPSKSIPSGLQGRDYGPARSSPFSSDSRFEGHNAQNNFPSSSRQMENSTILSRNYGTKCSSPSRPTSRPEKFPPQNNARPFSKERQVQIIPPPSLPPTSEEKDRPSDINNFPCETCRCTITGGYTNILKHMNTKEHRDKEKESRNDPQSVILPEGIEYVKNGKFHICTICGCKISRYTPLARHVASNSHVSHGKSVIIRLSQKYFHCTVCGCTLTGWTRVLTHAKRESHQRRKSQAIIQNLPAKLPPGEFSQSSKGYVMGKLPSGIERVHSKSNNILYICTICGCKVGRSETVDEHAASRRHALNGDQVIIRKQERKFYCKLCNSSIYGYMNVLRHLKTAKHLSLNAKSITSQSAEPNNMKLSKDVGMDDAGKVEKNEDEKFSENVGNSGPGENQESESAPGDPEDFRTGDEEWEDEERDDEERDNEERDDEERVNDKGNEEWEDRDEEVAKEDQQEEILIDDGQRDDDVLEIEGNIDDDFPLDENMRERREAHDSVDTFEPEEFSIDDFIVTDECYGSDQERSSHRERRRRDYKRVRTRERETSRPRKSSGISFSRAHRLPTGITQIHRENCLMCLFCDHKLSIDSLERHLAKGTHRRNKDEVISRDHKDGYRCDICYCRLFNSDEVNSHLQGSIHVKNKTIIEARKKRERRSCDDERETAGKRNRRL
ncbi:uncharacterized protein [Fopius arisanus]|uniref:C2H2-type domain-containing protein n=1 Tax=Fopius arisanus TaxID=64838 RepID=A0A9R1TGH3_9HYME|nr:PREDICTED: uncharacterized protein LOC105269743 [Fopius arisanus]